MSLCMEWTLISIFLVKWRIAAGMKNYMFIHQSVSCNLNSIWLYFTEGHTKLKTWFSGPLSSLLKVPHWHINKIKLKNHLPHQLLVMWTVPSPPFWGNKRVKRIPPSLIISRKIGLRTKELTLPGLNDLLCPTEIILKWFTLSYRNN